MRLLSRRRPQPVAPPVDILTQLGAALEGAYTTEPVAPPTRRRRLRSWAWRRRRSHGIPLALFVVVFALGHLVDAFDVPAFAVAVTGWVGCFITYFRAGARHFFHTLSVAAFIAVWLFLVALS